MVVYVGRGSHLILIERFEEEDLKQNAMYVFLDIMCNYFSENKFVSLSDVLRTESIG